MDRLLPIEAGCRALFVGWKNVPSCEVQVIQRRLSDDPAMHPPGVDIEDWNDGVCVNCGAQDLGWICSGLPAWNGFPSEWACECLLLRIDGGDVHEREDERESGVYDRWELVKT